MQSLMDREYRGETIRADSVGKLELIQSSYLVVLLLKRLLLVHSFVNKVDIKL